MPLNIIKFFISFDLNTTIFHLHFLFAIFSSLSSLFLFILVLYFVSPHIYYIFHLFLNQPFVIFPRTYTEKSSIQSPPLSFVPSNVPSPFINPIYISLFPSGRYPLTCSLFFSFSLSFPPIAHTWVYSSVMWMRVSAWYYHDYHTYNPGCVTNRHIVA